MVYACVDTKYQRAVPAAVGGRRGSWGSVHKKRVLTLLTLA